MTLMMKILGAILLWGASSHAQTEVKVIAFLLNGNVLYSEAEQLPKQMTLYQPIAPNSQVILSTGSVLKVVSGDRQIVEFRGVDTLRYEDIVNKLKKVQANESKGMDKIWEYLIKKIEQIWRSLLPGEGDTLASAAVRSGGSTHPIPLAPRNGYALGEKIEFAWERNGYFGAQAFSIVDEQEDTLYRTEVYGTTLSLEIARAGLKSGNVYYWSVSRPDSPGTDVPFRIVERKTAKIIERELQNAPELAGTDSLSLNLIRAMVFEQNQCYGNAYFEYAAARSRDTSLTVKNAFSIFLAEKLSLTRGELETVLSK